MRYIIALARFLDLAYKASLWLILFASVFVSVQWIRWQEAETAAKVAGDKAFWECHNPGDPGLHLPTCKFEEEDADGNTPPPCSFMR